MAKRKFFNDDDHLVVAHIRPCKTCSSPSFENAIIVKHKKDTPKHNRVPFLGSQETPTNRRFVRELGREICGKCA